MRATQYLLSTLKEIPHDTKIISHQLMLRSGMIRQIAAGLYIWLPIGIKVLKKIKAVIKKEMQKINALEVAIPIVQPACLWKKSGRLNIYGDELLKFFDRRKNQFILSPTNEEIITNFVNGEIHSYKELPLILYQIKTKFRDEIRPRFGIIRAREFDMKDAYSFHVDKDCLEKTYNVFYNSYINIFKKIQLKFLAVQADSGYMGGNISHEFQAFSENGEDEIVFSDNASYSSNMNMAESMETINFFKNKNQHKNIVNSIKIKKFLETSNILNIPIKKQIKTILVRTKINKTISVAALLIRGDHKLNIFKIEKIDILEKPLAFLSEEETIAFIGVKKNFLGPLGLKIPIIADISTYKMKNFTIGANITERFFTNVNWNIDLPLPNIQDIRKVTQYDFSPNNSGLLNIKKSIEIGHIFQLGRKYSKIMNTSFQAKNGNQKNLYMGCYGIGITRIVATIIEQNYDDNGIIWPDLIAPFEVAILPINIKKSIKVEKIADYLYKKFKKKGIDVILDDRNKRPGIMLNEIDLIGIPHQIIVSTRYIENNNIEYRTRKNKKSTIISIEEIINFIIQKLKK